TASFPATSPAIPARACSSTAGEPTSPPDRAALLPCLPLAGHTQDHPDACGRGIAQRRGLRHLHVELVDEQEGHAGLDIVEQLLQCRLLQLAAHDEADEAILDLRARDIDLRGLHRAADLADRRRNP